MQNELVFSSKVCDDQKKKKKKKGLCLPSSGFSVSKEKNKNKWCHPKMVTPGAGRPPCDATGFEYVKAQTNQKLNYALICRTLYAGFAISLCFAKSLRLTTRTHQAVALTY